MNINDLIQTATDKFKESGPEKELPQSLPLVENFCKDRMAADAFADLDVLFIQHHLGPFTSRLRAMCDYGLDTSKCWFIDIPYSTNKRVRQELVAMGFPESQMSRPFEDPIEPYSRRQRERVDYIIRLLANQNNKRRLLVVDDGAYFIRTLRYLLPRNEDLVSDFGQRGTCVVEQTTRGLRYLQEQQYQEMLGSLRIPVVSIARTPTKHDLESPFIGAAVSQAVVRIMTSGQWKDRNLGAVLVIGFGAVGRETTKQLSALKHGGPIHVYDKQWESLKKDIEGMGAHVLQEFPREGPYDSVFGCTGYASFPVSEVGILSDNAILVSGSSAAIEFNREEFIDLAYEFDDDDFYVIEPERTRSIGIRATIDMQKGSQRFSFISAGFPANFNGELECLPALIIQITHGLLLAASQETLGKAPGLHQLNRDDDQWLYRQGLYWIEQYTKGSSIQG